MKLTSDEFDYLCQNAGCAGLERYEGIYYGRFNVQSEYAFIGNQRQFNNMILGLVSDAIEFAIDGEVEIVEGFKKVIEYALNMQVDDFGKELIYY